MDARTGEQHTFQQMKEKIIKCSLAMNDIGIGNNDVVMVCTHNQFDAYVPFFATLFLGAVVIPLDEYIAKGLIILSFA